MMLVLIDCHGLAHRVKHSMKELSHNDRRTGVIYGFLKYIINYAEKFSTNHFLFAWDSSTSLREAVYPQYRAKRKQAKAELSKEDKEYEKLAHQQFNELRQSILPQLGFLNIFYQRGIEADDIIAKAVRLVNYEQALTDMIIVTADNDMYQLLSNNVSIFNPQTNKPYTKDHFMKEFGLQPKQWVLVKCLAGCGTDEVGGIDNIGISRAVDFIKGKMSPTSKYASNIANGWDITKRNFPLIRLPHQQTKGFQIQFNEVFKLENFIALCEDYGFESFLRPENLNKWRYWFQMEE